MQKLPREAREGVMRVWLEILREKHLGVTWVPAQDAEATTNKAATAAEVLAA